MSDEQIEKDITVVKGVVLDYVSPNAEDSWLIGQIILTANPKNDGSMRYIGKEIFVFNKAAFPELWEIYKDDPLLDTGRVPQVEDLNEHDKFYVIIRDSSSIVDGGMSE